MISSAQRADAWLAGGEWAPKVSWEGDGMRGHPSALGAGGSGGPPCSPCSPSVYFRTANQTFLHPTPRCTQQQRSAYCTNLRKIWKKKKKTRTIFRDLINNSLLKRSLQVLQVVKCCKWLSLRVEISYKLENRASLFSKYPTENVRGSRMLKLQYIGLWSGLTGLFI